MRAIIVFTMLFSVLWAGQSQAGEANLFNPYMHERLPSQKISNADKEMAKSMGGKSLSLQDEASHRTFWRQEVYPLVFGNAMAKSEIIVFIDYALPNSEAVWGEVVKASKSLNAQSSKIIVFSKNSEQYGTELMGGGIWIAHSRPAYAMDFFSYSLRRWNEVKRTQAANGTKRPFVYEYDATANKKDFPILYSYLILVKPALTNQEHNNITKYAFDAGNVNMYQATTAAKEYDVEQFPAVVVNGEHIKKPTAQSILNALE